MAEDFYLEKRIYYHDTDAEGVVYYARYLEHLEEARSEYYRAKGIDINEYVRRGLILAVVHLEIDYKSPAHYGDKIKVFARVEEIGNASIHFAQEIKRDNLTLVKAKVVLAYISKDFKAQPIPEEIKKILSV